MAPAHRRRTSGARAEPGDWWLGPWKSVSCVVVVVDRERAVDRADRVCAIARRTPRSFTHGCSRAIGDSLCTARQSPSSADRRAPATRGRGRVHRLRALSPDSTRSWRMVQSPRPQFAGVEDPRRRHTHPTLAGGAVPPDAGADRGRLRSRRNRVSTVLQA